MFNREWRYLRSWFLTSTVFIFQYMANEPLCDILNEIRNSVGLYAKCQLYGILIKREGINYEINGTTGALFYLLFLSTSFILHLLIQIVSCIARLHHSSPRSFESVISTSWLLEILDGRALLQQFIKSHSRQH